MRRTGFWMAMLVLVVAVIPGNGQGRPTYGQRVSALLQQNPDLPYSPIGILVRFDPAVPESARAQARAAIAGTLNTRYELVPDLELVETNIAVERALSILGGLPSVEYAEPDYTLTLETTPNDPSFGLLWGLDNTGQTIPVGRKGDRGTAGADIGAVEAWSLWTGDPNFVVAVIDSGAYYDHLDLSPNMWTNPGEMGLDAYGNDKATNGVDDDGNGYIDDFRGWDFIMNNNDPNYPDSHGTHVSGTIGAVGNNGVGVTGINWHCKIMPLAITEGVGMASQAIVALEYAVNMGARVPNCSWGITSYSESLYDAISAARDAGHLMVAAAGNYSSDTTVNPLYPAAYDLDNIISVAATDNDDQLASFSNYGASVDLGAPGVNVYSTVSWDLGGTYGYMSGTSMAAPHVTGVAALVWSMNPAWTYSQVRDRILAAVPPVDSLQGKTVTGGVVSASAALGVTVPVAPSGLTVAKIGATVRLTWQDNSTAENGFDIQREKKVGNNWTNTTSFGAPADAMSFSDAPGRGTFRYRVRAWNTIGASDWTDWKSVTM
jgi:subtilisin family serine protease